MVGLTLDEAQEKGIVIGLKDVSDVRYRLDIDSFMMTKPDCFNLFILAVGELQKDSGNMGWFEVAGIHGYPSRDWDGVKGRNETEDPREMYGYCEHASVLFPFWHRPYMAMMEQTIYHSMVKKAEEFVGEPMKWKTAAEDFRLPYWDWLRPRAKQIGHIVSGIGTNEKSGNPFDYIFDLPRILKEKKVMVYLPSPGKPNEEKKLKSITNPLYSFSFEASTTKIPKDEWDSLNRDKYNQPVELISRDRTVRRPTVDLQDSDTLHVNDLLNKQRESNVIALLNLFVLETYSEYLRMSNHSATKGGGSGSIESLHDNYHNYLGGPAHMGDPRVAAFDPVFWFHHCNIDRIMAIWQATHPKRWFPATTPGNKGPDDPLYPFRAFKDGKVDWWTSNDSIDTKKFGYTYADLDPTDAGAVFEAFGRNYVWSIHEESRPDGFGDAPPEEMEPVVVNDSPFFKYEVSKKPAFPGGFHLTSQVKTEPIELPRNIIFKVAVIEGDGTEAQEETSSMSISSTEVVNKVPEQATPQLEVSDTKTEQPKGTKAVRNWYVDSMVPKKAFNGSATFFYFVTGQEYIRKPYSQEPSLAALNHIFAAPVEACANCAQQAESGLIISDTEPITPILWDIVNNTSYLESIEPEHVVPFLKNNFQIRVLGPGSEDVKPYNIEGLKLSISTTVQYFKPGSLIAIEGPKNRFPEITDPILTPPAATTNDST
ncbi:hypothetical protein MMC11_007330 [Xylographa trunciseda]|nr:hypothetical protein [Xylographa trunciseda]